MLSYVKSAARYARGVNRDWRTRKLLAALRNDSSRLCVDNFDFGSFKRSVLNYLDSNPSTGLWGDNRIDRPNERSRMIQFAYHPMFFYDHDIDHFDAPQILCSALKTQNPHGGFGVRANSSACEDIDSIDLLIRLSPRASTEQTPVIEHALRRATDWILLNQMADGGFVFRLDEPFVYGARETSSGAGESALFPTWFRTLTLAYLANHIGLPNGFSITRCPGYEF